jgi:hypothetical protein
MHRFLLICSAAFVLALTGCEGALDPTERPGNYTMTGAANETIAQQAAFKNELIQGTNEPGSDGIMARSALAKITTTSSLGTAGAQN